MPSVSEPHLQMFTPWRFTTDAMIRPLSTDLARREMNLRRLHFGQRFGSEHITTLPQYGYRWERA